MQQLTAEQIKAGDSDGTIYTPHDEAVEAIDGMGKLMAEYAARYIDIKFHLDLETGKVTDLRKEIESERQLREREIERREEAEEWLALAEATLGGIFAAMKAGEESDNKAVSGLCGAVVSDIEAKGVIKGDS